MRIYLSGAASDLDRLNEILRAIHNAEIDLHARKLNKYVLQEVKVNHEPTLRCVWRARRGMTYRRVCISFVYIQKHIASVLCV